jgi:hypothetical protein
LLWILTVASNMEGDIAALSLEEIRWAFEQSRSLGEDVAGTERTSVAIIATKGNAEALYLHQLSMPQSAGALEVILKGNASDLMLAVRHKVTAVVVACLQ